MCSIRVILLLCSVFGLPLMLCAHTHTHTHFCFKVTSFISLVVLQWRVWWWSGTEGYTSSSQENPGVIMEAGTHRIYTMILHNRACTLLGKRICCQQEQWVRIKKG